MMAFLPPISQTTFLTNGWPSARVAGGRGGSPGPTSFEPVKAIRATRGSRTRHVAHHRGRRRAGIAGRPPGTPACQRMSHISRAMPRVCDRRLDDGRVARHQRGGGHAGADGQGEVPGADDRGHAAGLVPLVVQLADEPAQARRGWNSADGHAGVILAEVDGLADVGVGLAPGLARLANHHGRPARRGGRASARRPRRGSPRRSKARVAPGGKGRGRRAMACRQRRRRTAATAGTFDRGHLGQRAALSGLGKSRSGSLTIGRPSPSRGLRRAKAGVGHRRPVAGDSAGCRRAAPAAGDAATASSTSSGTSSEKPARSHDWFDVFSSSRRTR